MVNVPWACEGSAAVARPSVRIASVLAADIGRGIRLSIPGIGKAALVKEHNNCAGREESGCAWLGNDIILEIRIPENLCRRTLWGLCLRGRIHESGAKRISAPTLRSDSWTVNASSLGTRDK